jgi:hypothetical protein
MKELEVVVELEDQDLMDVLQVDQEEQDLQIVFQVVL